MGLTHAEALLISPELAALHPDAASSRAGRSGWSRENKYGAKRSRHRGIRCDSLAERAHFQELDRDPNVAWWVDHPRFHLTEHDVYEADALVVLRSPIFRDWHALEVHDVKGYRTRRFNHICHLWADYGPCSLVIIHRGRREGIIEPFRESIHA